MKSIEASRGDAAMWVVMTAFAGGLFAAVPIWVVTLVVQEGANLLLALVIIVVVTPFAAFVLVYFVMAVQVLVMRGPVITIGPDGFCDRRVSAHTVPWDRLRWYRQTKSSGTLPASGPYHLDVIAYDVVGPYQVRPQYRVFSWYLRLIRNLPWRVVPIGVNVRAGDLARAMRAYSMPIEPPSRRRAGPAVTS